MFTRIRWRMVGWSMLVLGLVLVVLGTVVYLLLSNGLMDEVDRNLTSRAEEIGASDREFGEHATRLGHEGYSGGLFYLAVDTTGRVLADPQGVSLASLGFPENLPSGDAPVYKTITLDGDPTRLYLRQRLDQRSGPTILVVGQSLLPEQGALAQLQMVLVVGGVAGLALSFLGAWFLSGRALIPVQTAFRRQQEFVTDAAHELRTPLAIMRSAMDLLNRHGAEPLHRNRDLFDDVQEQIKWLERLVGDLLTLARSDMDQLDLNVGLVDVSALVGEVVRLTSPLATSRGITLEYQAAAQPLFVEGDPDRLQQVLLILLDNALDHTPEGGRIAAAARREDKVVCVQVQDTGEGIPTEHLPHVFGRFYRADKARSRANGGVGLGLAIAKSLVDRHGGQLTIASVVASGTTVTMHLPACD